MKRLVPWVLIALIWTPAIRAQSALLTVLAGRGGAGGCPAFNILPGGTTFFVDPLGTPEGVAVDVNGKLFVATANCVFRLDADGLLRLGFPDSGPFRIGTGTSGFADGLDAGLALLSNPQHMALDTSGNLFIADTSNGRVRKVDLNTWTISTVAGGGSLRPNDGVLATNASFLFLTSVAADRHGNLFIVDSNAGKVYKVDTNGVLARFAGSGAFTYNGEGIPALSAGMIPMDVEVDATDNVYIADWSNSIVRKVTPGGVMTTVAGNPFNVTGLGDGGPAAFGGILNKPRGIGLDASGNLFIADTNNHRIRKVDTSGTITTVAGDGTAGFLDTQLNFPYDVAADNLGNIFIADTGNNQLRGVIVSERTYALALNTAGTGSGTLSGSGSYIVGHLASVSATAAAGSSFVNWSGPNAAECAAGIVLMTANKTCTANFSALIDTTPPVLSNVPASMTLFTSSPAGAVAAFALPTASDPDDAAGPVTCAPASGSSFPIGTTTVTCSSTDTHANTGSASFTVTVALIDLSFSVNESITITDDVAEAAALLVAVAEPITVTDTTAAAPALSVVVDEPITVSDSAIVPPDTTAPVLSGVPTPITLEATGPGGAIAAYDLPTASDPDDPAGPVTCSPQSKSLFALGVTTVTCRSTDTHGNVGSASFTVTIADTTAPALLLPLAVTLDATSPAGAAVAFSPVASDVVNGSVAVACTPASGATFPIGATTVRCSAQDAAGNVAIGSFTVNVLGPSQMIANLIGALGGSFTQGVNLLQNALRSLARGNTLSACGQIDAFANQVSAQAGKALTTAQAAQLLAIAADIRAAAGCR